MSKIPSCRLSVSFTTMRKIPSLFSIFPKTESITNTYITSSVQKKFRIPTNRCSFPSKKHQCLFLYLIILIIVILMVCILTVYYSSCVQFILLLLLCIDYLLSICFIILYALFPFCCLLVLL